MRSAKVILLLMLSWASTANAQKKTLLDEPIDRPIAWTTFWCPSAAFIDGRFVADGEEATLVFKAQIHPTFSPTDSLLQRIDNVTVVKSSVYDSHLATVSTDSFFCLPDPPELFFFHDVPAPDLVFQDTFAQGANSGWDTSQGAFFVTAANSQPILSAPNNLNTPSEHGGGSLGLGHGDNPQEFATTSIVVHGLVPGVEYILDFWWKTFADLDSTGGGEIVHNGDLFVQVLGTETIRVTFDVRPGRCPNPLNVKSKEPFFAAILGTANLDVSHIDVGSLRVLGSVAPVRSGLGDVGSPPATATACACPGGRDGIPDLTLRFSAADIMASLGPVANGDSRQVPLTGNLLDGTPLQGTDCVVIRVPGSDPTLETSAGPLLLGAGPPLPGRVRSIQYSLAEAGPVRLLVYDAAGRVVARLLDGVQPAGVHEVSWDTTHVASGIYFMRLESAGSTRFAKTVVVR